MSDEDVRRAGLPRRTLKIALPTIAALAAGGAIAAAAIPASDGEISGCYSKSTADIPGALRVIDATDSCRSDENPISWNQQGPQGEPGAKGDKGDTGPQGPQGPQGPAGSSASSGGGGGTPEVFSPAGLYLRIDGVNGTATGTHKGAMAISSFQWGAGTSRSGKQVSKVSLSDFTVTKQADKTSPTLFDAVSRGKHFDSATITSFSKGQKSGTEVPTYQYRLTDAVVDGLSQSSGGDRPSESLSISYDTIKVTTTDPDGTQTEATYDLTRSGKLVRVK
jgi:type VI secretion system secreted protein Hcp